MRRRIIMLILILACFLAQCTVWGMFPIGNVKPNLLLVLTVAFALMRGRKSGMITGLISGLVMDLYFSRYFGLCGLIYMYIGYFVGGLYKFFFDEDIRMPMLLVAVSDFAYGIIYYLFRLLFKMRFDFGAYLKHIIVPELVYTVAVTLVLYRVFFVINRKLSEREREEEESPWLLK